MRVIVPIKQVPETNAVKMDEETGTMIREGVEAIVNPLDLYAIEAALQLKESHDAEVVVLSMGPPNAAKALREAISMGCDSGILLSDRKFAGADTWATAYVLAAAIRKAGLFDLILCGERATDGDTGQVGPGIAAFLDLPVATYVGAIDKISRSMCTVRRLVETGHELLELDLPAVLTVVKEIAVPRLPTLRGKQRARRAELPAWDAEQLEVMEENLGLTGSPTRVVKVFRPQVARECETHVARDEQAVHEATGRLVEFLRQRELI
ncbi:MAG: electron transfer flavoprotein subunit beta/FixA family protein [Planctomycetota bacterium]